MWEQIAGSTLVKSRDQAKKLLNHWSSSASDSATSFTTGSTQLEASSSLQSAADMAAFDAPRRGSARPSSAVGGPISGIIHRPSLAENLRTESNSSAHSNSSGTGPIPGIGEEKPIASGNGVSLSIALAEPVLFLQGFDHSDLGNQTTTMLRGTFHLRVSRSAKIKTVSLAFRGRAETEWPEGRFTFSLIYDSPSKCADHMIQVSHPGRQSLGTRRV